MTTPTNPTLHLLRAAACDGQNLRLYPSESAPSTADPASVLLECLSAAQRSAAGLVLATHFGSLRTDQEFDRSRRDAAGRYSSPAAFTRTLPSSFPTELSIRHTLQGPILVLSPPPDADPLHMALSRGHAWLHHFPLNHVLAGVFDEFPQESLSIKLFLLARVPCSAAVSIPLTSALRLF